MLKDNNLEIGAQKGTQRKLSWARVELPSSGWLPTPKVKK